MDYDIYENYDETSAQMDLDSVSLYLKQISNIPLLTAEEEKELGLRIADGDKKAMDKLVSHNLRLVVSIAKRYRGCGIPLLDLIQEGNIGLMKAAEKFDLNKGCRFNTHATWWVRQTINRSLADKSRTIRIPSNVSELVNKIKKVSAPMIQKLNRFPTSEELSAELGIEIDKIETALDMSQAIASLDVPVSEDEETNMGDLIADPQLENPIKKLTEECNKEIVESVLSTLTKREADVLRRRFGIETGEPQTLEEIGQSYGVTRERIRQIETKAMRKMRNPMRVKVLKEAL
jgi:RNA polymerase primary sigma factor